MRYLRKRVSEEVYRDGKRRALKLLLFILFHTPVHTYFIRVHTLNLRFSAYARDAYRACGWREARSDSSLEQAGLLAIRFSPAVLEIRFIDKIDRTFFHLTDDKLFVDMGICLEKVY